MQLVDRIEKRRFVGREFLLWLWFESEIFDATLSTHGHGTFGMWVQGQLALSSSKAEATRIRGVTPAAHREAKEALQRGKLPEMAGIHLSWQEQEASFVLKAEQLAISALKLPAVLGRADGEEAEGPASRRRRPSRRGAEDAAEQEADGMREAFYERMRLTRTVEEVLEALYRDFLTLRLGAGWDGCVVPALARWTRGEDVDGEAYREARARALGADAKRHKRAG